MNKSFKLATTSFIKKDTRLNNAIYLASKVDEVELLYFDSKHSHDLPDEEEVLKLQRIELSYNIHMPIDLNLKDKRDWQVIINFAEKLKMLKPSTYTIHPVYDSVFFKELENFTEDFGSVSIENIDNNLKIFETIMDMPIDICFDIGHAILFDVDIYKFIEKYGSKISHIHLHGVTNSKDHKDISYLESNLLKFIIDFANSKRLTLCLEIFNETDFVNSMKIFENYL